MELAGKIFDAGMEYGLDQSGVLGSGRLFPNREKYLQSLNLSGGDVWVSVEDVGLPLKGERVIVCTDNYVVACCYINDFHEWKLAYDSSLFIGTITHYHALLNPPTK